MQDSADTPAPARVTTAGGLDALRRALDGLLRGREPAAVLPDVLRQACRQVPGYHWGLVVDAVLDGMLNGPARDEIDAISTTFNRLAGVPGNSLLNSGDSHPASPPGQSSAVNGRQVSAVRKPIAITMTAPEARTLRVIRNFPAYSLCQLEGRNGIGKTLAARLLELASGKQPFSALPNAWLTLKDQLGPAMIEISGLPEGHLEIKLTPPRWPEKPIDSLGDLLGAVTLDGIKIDWPQARELFQVVRISGDESLVDALARALQVREQQALQWNDILKNSVGNWNKPLFNLQDQLGHLSTDRLQKLLADVATTKETAAGLREIAEQARQNAELATQAQIILQSALQRRRDIPPLIQELSDVNGQLAQNVLDRQSVGLQLFTASKALGLDGQRRVEVSKWQRLRTLRSGALQRAQSDEDWYLLQIGDDHRPTWDQLSSRRAEVARRRTKALANLAALDVTKEVRKLGIAIEDPLKRAPETVLRQQIARTDTPLTGKALLEGIRRRRNEIDGHPTSGEIQEAENKVEAAEKEARLLQYLAAAMETTDRKRGNLSEAEEKLHGLLDQSQGVSQQEYQRILDAMRVLQANHAAKIQQREGIQFKLARLLSQDVPESSEIFTLPAVRDLAAEEDAEEQALLSGTSAAIDPYQPNEQSTDDGNRLDLPTDPNRWTEIWDELCATDRQMLGRLGYNLDLSSFRESDSQDAYSLTDAFRTASAATQDATRQARDAAEAVARALDTLELQQDTVAQERHNLRNTSLTLLNQPGSWDRWLPGLMELLKIVGGSSERIEEFDSMEVSLDDLRLTNLETMALRWLETIAWLCGRISDASDGVRDGLNSIAGILRAEAYNLSPRIVTPRGDEAELGIRGEYVDRESVREWAEKELADLLNTPALQRALFNEAQSVDLNLQTATVSWAASDGSYMNRRPLEAFSSGEQVFAYTRARLEQLTADPTWRGHRLVILDEFGAFVARNRFAQLLEFVQKQALGSLADQIIVMLPLSSAFADETYAQELLRGASSAGRRSELHQRVRQVEDDGYFTVQVGGDTQ